MSSDQNLIGTDFSSFIEDKRRNSFLSLEADTNFFNVFLFFKNLVAWVIWRVLRMVSRFVGFLIALERMILNLKSDTLQVFYWGRSNIFGVFLQSVLLFILLSTAFTFFMGGLNSVARASASGITPTSTTQSQPETVAAGDTLTSQSQDTLVETGSLETITPQETTRLEMEIYTVKPGDTLASVADAYDLNSDSIRWANNIKKGGDVTAGQQLKIPQGDGVMYTVQNGDNLDLIAAKFKASQQAIGDANYLDIPVNLTTGQELFIPGAVLAENTPKAATAVRRAPRGNPVSVPSGVTRFLSWPVKGGAGRVTQCPSYIHNAVDIADSSGPMLVAAAPGRVTYAGYHPSGYAWVVEIDHGNGYTTLYAHMVPGSIQVQVGDYVDRGAVLGRMGQSGRAFGVHVHFEVASSGYLKKSKRTLVPPPAYMLDFSGRDCFVNARPL